MRTQTEQTEIHALRALLKSPPGGAPVIKTRLPKQASCIALTLLLTAGVLNQPDISNAAGNEIQAKKSVSVQWRNDRPQGQIVVTDGRLLEMEITRGKGTLQGENRFSAAQDGPFRLNLLIAGSETRCGKGSTIVTLDMANSPFSFFLRDVDRQYPIYVPAYGVAVTTAADGRSYPEIENAIRARGWRTNLQRMESEPEESYETAAAGVREVKVETWLGLSRDMRLFAVDPRLESVQPKFAGYPVLLPETNGAPSGCSFMIGRGWGVLDAISRRLEDGVLPILCGTLVDDDITYELTAFATLEKSVLSPQSLRGTHFLVADGHGAGHTFTKEQQAQFASLLAAELNRDEETVLCMSIEAVNTAPVPRYAFFNSPAPNGDSSFDGGEGLRVYKSGRVFSVSRLNGKPLSQEEVAIKLMPGESANFEVYMPHRPISRDRALALTARDFGQRRQECRAFWRAKLESAAQISLPDPPLNRMIQAGLLQMDLIMYGLEPNGTLEPAIGRYNAIGVYSDKTIQFMDSMGWHDIARRALAYFLEKQRDDGFIQNFSTYMAETGAVLANMGEHYRYTRDDQWVKQIAPKLVKSCEFIRRWRRRNQRDDLRGKGYGLIEGQTADPVDPYHSFLLNGYAYLGLSRCAEMLAAQDPAESAKWRREAAALKRDIRAALFDAMGKSPVIPLGDGSWCPTVPPWTESRGPLLLYADGGKWFSHRAFSTRDSLLGPLYLVVTEVLEPHEPATTFLLSFHNELMTRRNVAFSQPYLSRHSLIHLLRGEEKAFLKAHYNLLASIADRETHTWTEHFFGASPHSVDGLNWFLMDTRCMLYLEKGETLELLPGIPRSYLETGKRIDLKNVVSYFGPFSLHVESHLDSGRIQAAVAFLTDRRPKRLELRLPHPEGRKAAWVKGGAYDPQTERVSVEPFHGRAEVTVGF
jgi:hypothetical protein